MIGDRWSLLILRDLMLRDKCYYDEMAASDEGISSNILASRLKQLEKNGLISKVRDQQNLRRYIYQPTHKALDLLPVILEMAFWGACYDSNSGVPPEVVTRFRNDREKMIVAVREKFESLTK